MCELLLDTDVLIKLAAYGLLDTIAHPGCAAGCDRRTGLVAAAAFVARKRLPRKAADPTGAVTRLEAFLAAAAALEPTADELALAAELEEAATRVGLDLDVGESQLCAIAVSRNRPVILTGDKRAIVAVEQLLNAVGAMIGLVRRMACLEQAMGLAVQRLGALAVRAMVVTERGIDKAMSICFRSSSERVAADFEPEGLASYVGHLRGLAPTALLPGDVLSATSVP